MNHPNLKEKFQCYYEKPLLSKTVQLVTFTLEDYMLHANQVKRPLNINTTRGGCPIWEHFLRAF